MTGRFAFACTIALLGAAPAAASPPSGRQLVPAPFYAQALCVHSGWHWQQVRPLRLRRRRAADPELPRRLPPPAGVEYRLPGGAMFRRSWDVPDGTAGGSGEGGWTAAGGSYGGGLQFTLSTWNRAAALSGGAVPFAASTWAIARQPPRVQLLAAFLIVRQDGGSWREWPQTSRACGWA